MDDYSTDIMDYLAGNTDQRTAEGRYTIRMVFERARCRFTDEALDAHADVLVEILDEDQRRSYIPVRAAVFDGPRFQELLAGWLGREQWTVIVWDGRELWRDDATAADNPRL